MLLANESAAGFEKDHELWSIVGQKDYAISTKELQQECEQLHQRTKWIWSKDHKNKEIKLYRQV